MWIKRKKSYLMTLSAIIVLSAGLSLTIYLLNQDPAELPMNSENSLTTELIPHSDQTEQETNVTPHSDLSPQEKMKSTPSPEKEDDRYERLRTVMILRDIKSPEAITQLASFLNDSEDAVAMEAIDALGYIALNSEYGEMVFNILKKKAEEQMYPFRSNALITAAMLGMDEQMMPLIAGFMADNSEEAMAAASRAMTFIASEQCIPYLEKIIDNTNDPDLSRNALNALAKIDSPKSLAALATLLKDEKTSKQNLAAWALSRTDNAHNTELLVNAIQSDTLTDEALGIIASSPAAGQVFNEILANETATRERMLDLINIISENTKEGSSTTRNDVTDLLALLLNSNDPEIVAAAAEAMGDSQSTKDHTKELEPILTSDSFLVQEKALEAYAQYCTPTSYKPLLELYWDKDEKIRRSAFFLSSAFLNETDVKILEKAREHEDEFIAKQSKVILDNMISSN